MRVGVEHAAAERLPELGRELGEQARLRAGDGRAGAEQLGEQPVVHLRPPGQAVVAHLGGGQRAGRLGGQQQPVPAPGLRLLDGRQPALLLGVDGDHGGQRVGARRQLEPVGGEQRVLAVVGLRGAGLGQVGGHRQAAQPGPGGAQRPRGAEPALVGEQQCLDQPKVVAAGDPAGQPGEQRVVAGLGGGPHPARVLGGLPPGDGGGEVGHGDGRAERGARLVERLEPPAAAVRVGGEGDPGCHGAPPLVRTGTVRGRTAGRFRR